MEIKVIGKKAKNKKLITQNYKIHFSKWVFHFFSFFKFIFIIYNFKLEDACSTPFVI